MGILHGVMIGGGEFIARVLMRTERPGMDAYLGTKSATGSHKTRGQLKIMMIQKCIKIETDDSLVATGLINLKTGN
jgi:hypothetical protein